MTSTSGRLGPLGRSISEAGGLLSTSTTSARAPQDGAAGSPTFRPAVRRTHLPRRDPRDAPKGRSARVRVSAARQPDAGRSPSTRTVRAGNGATVGPPALGHGREALPARRFRVAAASAKTPTLQGFPGSGRSRTRTWDLFLIRKTFCPLQSSQLTLNPCKPLATAAAEGDWRGLAATSWWPHRGPTAAVRGQIVVRPGSGHHADDTVKPGRSGGVPLHACMIASKVASLGKSRSSITRL